MFKTSRIKPPRAVSIMATTALTAGVAISGAATASADEGYGGSEAVVTTSALSIRSAPSTHTTRLGVLTPPNLVATACRIRGETIDGNDIWYRVGDRKQHWISARYVRDVGGPPGWCRDSEAVGQAATAVIKRAGPTHL